MKKLERANSQYGKMGQALFMIILLLGLMLPVSVAEAGWFDRLRSIYQIPENVENLQEQYTNTMQQVEEQKQKMEEQKVKLAEQQEKLSDAMQRSQLTEERLLAQNQELHAQNEALQTRLLAVEHAAQQKDKRLRQIKISIMTVAVLIILYFLMGRLFRVAVWRRQKFRRHL